MSDTPKLADESKKLLDSGWLVVIFKSELGSYTGIALQEPAGLEVQSAIDRAIEDYGEEDEEGNPIRTPGVCLTDDFEPSQVLYRLTEKVFGNIA